jgi:hypothetical protein
MTEYFKETAKDWLLGLEAKRRGITLATMAQVEERLGFGADQDAAHGSTVLAKCLRGKRAVGRRLCEKIKSNYRVNDVDLNAHLETRSGHLLVASFDDFTKWKWPRKPKGKAVTHCLDVALDEILATGLGEQPTNRRIFAGHERGEEILPLTADFFRVVVRTDAAGSPKQILGYWLAVPLRKHPFDNAVGGKFSLAQVKSSELEQIADFGGSVDVYCDAFVRASGLPDFEAAEIARLLLNSLAETVLQNCKKPKQLFINMICAYAWNQNACVVNLHQRVTPNALCEQFGLRRKRDGRRDIKDRLGNPVYVGSWESLLNSDAFNAFGGRSDETQQLLDEARRFYNERFR